MVTCCVQAIGAGAETSLTSIITQISHEPEDLHVPGGGNGGYDPPDVCKPDHEQGLGIIP